MVCRFSAQFRFYLDVLLPTPRLVWKLKKGKAVFSDECNETNSDQLSEDETKSTFFLKKMPKIVSRSIVSSSESQPRQANAPRIHIYRCNFCTTYCLALDIKMEQILPRRRTDNSFIIDRTKRKTCKVNCLYDKHTQITDGRTKYLCWISFLSCKWNLEHPVWSIGKYFKLPSPNPPSVNLIVALQGRTVRKTMALLLSKSQV